MLAPLMDAKMEDIQMKITEIFDFIKRNMWPPWADAVTVDSKQLVEWLGCSEKTLARMRKDGRLKGIKGMGTYHYKVIDLIKSLETEAFMRKRPANLKEILEKYLRKQLKME